jgi:ribosomal protein L18E
MYLVIAEYRHETVTTEVQTKKQVKEHIKNNKRDANGFEIYKVTKKLTVDDFQD